MTKSGKPSDKSYLLPDFRKITARLTKRVFDLTQGDCLLHSVGARVYIDATPAVAEVLKNGGLNLVES